MSEHTTIAELGAYVGREVTLRGWVQGKRTGGKVQFLQIRDGTGLCQCVVHGSKNAGDLCRESKGSRRPRISGT